MCVLQVMQSVTSRSSVQQQIPQDAVRQTLGVKMVRTLGATKRNVNCTKKSVSQHRETHVCGIYRNHRRALIARWTPAMKWCACLRPMGSHRQRTSRS